VKVVGHDRIYSHAVVGYKCCRSGIHIMYKRTKFHMPQWLAAIKRKSKFRFRVVALLLRLPYITLKT